MPDPIYKPKGPFPLYIEDLKKDTLGWSGEERFQYLELLDQMWWSGGFIEDDDGAIAEAMGLNRARNWREKVLKVKRKLESIEGESGFLTQHRVCVELGKLAELSLKRSEAGRCGGRPKKSIGYSNQKQIESTPSPSPSPSLMKKEDIGEDEDGIVYDADGHPVPAIHSNEPPKTNGKHYAFKGSTVRLLDADFERWKNAYPSIDLKAELVALDDFYTANSVKDWFVRCSAALAKKNRDAHEKGSGSSYDYKGVEY